MNWLAHLVLADRTDTSAAGQILGDLIKGRPEDTDFSSRLILGIRLHRHIDSTADAHPHHVMLRNEFAAPVRRYAGIVTDIGLDHALARRWGHDGADEPLARFCERMAERVADEWPKDTDHTAPDPRRFAALLTGYADARGIERALRHVSQRLSRANPLAHALGALKDHDPAFEAAIGPLMADLVDAVADRRDALAGRSALN